LAPWYARSRSLRVWGVTATPSADLCHIFDSPAPNQALKKPNAFEHVEIDLLDFIAFEDDGYSAVSFHSCEVFN
jgi:hypothetical protein